MTGVISYFPTLPASSVVGRLASGAGPAEAIPLAALKAALGAPFLAGCLAADKSFTNTITLADIAGLSFPIAANEQWVVSFDLVADSNGTSFGNNGLKLGLNAPSGATIRFSTTSLIAESGGLGSDTPGGATTTAINTAIVVEDSLDTGIAVVHAAAWILNGATAGTIQLRGCQAFSYATATILRKGATMLACRVS